MNGMSWSHFLTSVDRTHECWIWRGTITARGYGIYCVNGKRIMAHRFSFMHHKGQIPPELVLDHLCGNPACVNPIHLEAVTQHMNVLRAKGKLSKCIHRDRRNAPCKVCVDAHIAIVTKLKQLGKSVGYFQNRKWRLSHRETRQEGKKRYYEKSVNARNRRARWTTEDDQAILIHAYPDSVLVQHLGRSVRAIQIRRSRLIDREMNKRTNVTRQSTRLK